MVLVNILSTGTCQPTVLHVRTDGFPGNGMPRKLWGFRPSRSKVDERCVEVERDLCMRTRSH